MLSATPSSQLQVQVFTRNRNSRVTVRPSSTSKQHLMYQISGWNFSGKIRPLCADIYANQRTRRIVWNNLTLLNLIYYLFNLLSERIKIIYIKEKIVHRSCLTTIQNFIDRNTKDLFFFFISTITVVGQRNVSPRKISRYYSTHDGCNNSAYRGPPYNSIWNEGRGGG